MLFRRYMLTICALFLGISAVAAPVSSQETRLELDPARTTVKFTLADVLHTVRGDFKLKHGSLFFDPMTGKMGGDLVVDATSGNSGSEGRDRRMHKNILESERYPEIVFSPDRVEGSVAFQGNSQVRVHGIFKIHGVGHEMTVPVQVQMNNGQATVSAHFVVPYVQWGMKNPSTLFLRVSDKVDIDVVSTTR
ncbi:MAG: YceI family protein [Bryobacteraceae bacterium]